MKYDYGQVEQLQEEAEDRERQGSNYKKCFGRCSTCEYFQYVESEFGPLLAKCSMFDRLVSARNSVKNCSEYKEKGRLSLQTMWSLAIPIENKATRKAGFIRDEDEEKEDGAEE